MDEKTRNLERRARLLKAAEEFSHKLEDIPSVIEVVLIGSLASDDIYPNDIDLAIFLNHLDDLPSIAKYSRQISSTYHGWEVFVVSHDMEYLGRICHRKQCPSRSVDCAVPKCGEIPHLQVDPEFIFNPQTFLSSPHKVFWTRRSTSLFVGWRQSLNITEVRSPEILEPIEKICIECGKKFVYSVAQQKIFMKRGFSPPKRCEDCLFRKHLRWMM